MLAKSKELSYLCTRKQKEKTCFINQLKFYNYDTGRVKTEY